MDDSPMDRLCYLNLDHPKLLLWTVILNCSKYTVVDRNFGPSKIMVGNCNFGPFKITKKNALKVMVNTTVGQLGAV